MNDFLIKVLIAISFPLLIASVEAEVFGDGDQSNGIEDNRIPLVASSSLIYRRFVGTVECEGEVRGTAVLLDVDDLGGLLLKPVLLTARHVLLDQSAKPYVDCRYRPVGTSWNTVPISSYMFAGKLEDLPGQSALPSVIREYSSDWIVAELQPWPNWKHYAFPMSVESIYLANVDAKKQKKAFFVGYDPVENRLLVDPECEFGELGNTSILAGSDRLIWDSCDSARGSSGGALFTIVGSKPYIVGIRVGNLYDVDVHPDGPASGEEFDLDANVNVARVLDQDIRDAIRLLLERFRVSQASR